MTIPRSEQIDLNATSFYHVMNRCVRRSFLCGFDEIAQRDYTHRKAWIVDRMKFLANIFAIKICAYAIMSNHYHIVLFVDDDLVNQWSDAEVAQRWGLLFSTDAKINQHNPFKIKLWRQRLSSISWFMRCLNEKIARAANDEDDVGGRFWEGRFKSQALLDDVALLSAMAYVDLNPIRAGIAEKPEDAQFTSIFERLQFVKKQLQNRKHPGSKKSKPSKMIDIDKLPQPKSLLPFSVMLNEKQIGINFGLSDYLELVDMTGRHIKEGKSAGKIPDHLMPIMQRLKINPAAWLPMVKNITKKFSHAVGSEVFLLNFGSKRKRHLKGMRFAKMLSI